MAINPFQSYIALSLGSQNIYAAIGEKGTAYTAPCCALVNAANSTDVAALGSEALRMEGRTDFDSVIVHPIAYGGVADIELTAMLILNACESITGSRRPFDKHRLVLTYPEGATKVERAALVNAAELAGAKKVIALKAPIAAAVSAEHRLESAEGRVVVSIGASVTEISVISMGAVAASRHIKTGSGAFETAIIKKVREKIGLVIDRATAETLKKDMGSAVEARLEDKKYLNGVSIKTGRPVTGEISARDIYEALALPIDDIVSAICDALFALPAQFSADVLNNGIILTGGGAKLYGLDKRLKAETGLPVAMNENPEYDEAAGALRIVKDDKLLKFVLNAYSAYEA